MAYPDIEDLNLVKLSVNENFEHGTQEYLKGEIPKVSDP